MRQRREERSGTGRGALRRVGAALLAAVLALGQTIALVANAPQVAGAIDLGTMTVTQLEPIESYFPGISSAIGEYDVIHVDNSPDGLALCAKKGAKTPTSGTTYTNGRTGAGAKLDYVMYHGWRGEAGYGCTSGGFLLATMYAVWACVPNMSQEYYENVWHEVSLTYGSPTYPNSTAQGNVYDAINQLVSEAEAYAARGGGGPEEGCAILWPSTNGTNQPIVTRAWPTGGIELEKSSAATEVTDGNALYSLEGAVFGLYSDKGCAEDALVTTMTTDAQGRASAEGLAPGTYYLREITPPPGYAADPQASPVEVGSGKTTSVTCADVPQGNPVELVAAKVDAETGEGMARGGAALAGTEFTLRYYAGSYDSVDALPERATRTWVLRTGDDGRALLDEGHLVSGDALYRASDGTAMLPLGTVTVQETKAPEGYLLSDPEVRLQKITASGDAETLACYVAPTVADQVVRGDVSFTKAEEGTQSRMAGIPFKMTSLTTGEWHVLVTDENGMVDTSASWASREQGPNASDRALRDDGTVDEAALDASSGVWFGGAAEAATQPSDELGALPYDTYRIEELPCSANEGRRLVSTLVTISRDAVTLDLGTMDDDEIPTPAIATELACEGAKSAPAEEGVMLSDEIRYEGLVAGTQYRLVGELHSVGTDGTDLGIVAHAESDLVPDLSMGTTELSYEGVDATGLAGARLVSCVRLYEGERMVAAHEDLADEGQTVRVPAVRTTLLSDVTAAHDAPSHASSTVTDTVSLSGLTPGERYELAGTLRVVEADEDGTAAAGDEVATARTSFVASEERMEVQMSFELDGVTLAGRTVNAAEVLLVDGTVVAEHDDAGDEGQSVLLPALGSQARGAATGDQTSPSEGEQVLVDTVRLTNLLVGEEYVLRSSAHAREVLGDGTTTDGGALGGSAVELAFTATEQDMELEVEIPYDASELEGRDVVAFEELYREDVLLASHADVDDRGQTLVVPSVETTASVGEEDERELVAAAGQRVTDLVAMEGLVPGTSYELVATLRLRGTDERGRSVDLGPVTGEGGEPLRASASFVAEGEAAEVEVTLPLDASALEPGTDVVVFEELRAGGVTLARHADIANDDQTLRVVAPPETPSGDLPSAGEAASAAGAVGLAGTALVVGELARRRVRMRRERRRTRK